MDNPIFENIVLVIISGIVGFVLILLGSAFDMAFMSVFGGVFFGSALLAVIIGIILEVIN